MVRAWYMDDSDKDQRLEHHLEPPQFVSLDALKSIGVLHWHFNPATYHLDPEFSKLKLDRGYSYEDQIECSPSKLENYKAKLKIFFDEHIHTDEEIRFVLEGSGYFDVRDPADNWIRIEVFPGDLIVLPAGIFHRFTMDTNNYIKALRLFVGEPIWTPHPRSNLSLDHPTLLQYKHMFGGDRGLAETAG